MSQSAPLERVLIVAFSPIAQDARVLRQAKYLAPYFRVTVAGFGNNPFKEKPIENVDWFELDTRATVSKHDTLIQWWAVRLGAIMPRFYQAYYMQVPYFRHAWHLAQAARFRVVYCNDVDSLLVGVAACRTNRRCKLILDMHEYASRELGETAHWRWVRQPLVKGVLKHYAKLAQGTVTVVDSFVDLFHKEFGMKKPLVVQNAPELVPLPAREPNRDGKIHLIHHGACMKLRRLELMIEMMRYLDDRFVLHFMLTPNANELDYRAFLEAEAAKPPAGRVVFHPSVLPHEIVPTIANYDIGLFLLPADVFNYEHALPNKFFDFVSAGLGVAIGPSPNMAKLTRENGIGWIADDFKPETLARVLNAITPAELAEKRAASLKLRETLNADTEMAKLVALVTKIAAVKKT